MNLRRLLPLRVRWHYAKRWVLAAEAAELMVELSEDPKTKNAFARNAMEHYLRALAWRELDGPDQLPPPSDVGGPVAPGGQSTVPCVICGTAIRRPRENEVGKGLYCARCET